VQVLRVLKEDSAKPPPPLKEVANEDAVVPVRTQAVYYIKVHAVPTAEFLNKAPGINITNMTLSIGPSTMSKV